MQPRRLRFVGVEHGVVERLVLAGFALVTGEVGPIVLVAHRRGGPAPRGPEGRQRLSAIPSPPDSRRRRRSPGWAAGGDRSGGRPAPGARARPAASHFPVRSSILLSRSAGCPRSSSPFCRFSSLPDPSERRCPPRPPESDRAPSSAPPSCCVGRRRARSSAARRRRSTPRSSARFAADCERGDARGCRPARPGADDDQRGVAAAADGRCASRRAGRRVPGAGRGVADARPNPLGDVDEAYARLQEMFEDPPPVVLDALTRDPQTNEVGRSAALAVGSRPIGRATGSPDPAVRDREQRGAQPARSTRTSATAVGAHGVRRLAVAVRRRLVHVPGRLPGATPIVERRGCDIHPIDATSVGRRGDVDVVRVARPVRTPRPASTGRWRSHATCRSTIDTESADVWVERHVVTEPGTATVLMHSVMWQYMPDAVQRRITATLHDRGARATRRRAARVGLDGAGPAAVTMDLSLTLWPGGERACSRIAAVMGRRSNRCEES